VTSKFQDIVMAQKALDRLEEVIRGDGLPAVYSTFEEYLVDWSMDLPWDPEGRIRALRWLLTYFRAQRLAEMAKERFKYELLAFWEVGLEYAKELEEEEDGN